MLFCSSIIYYMIFTTCPVKEAAVMSSSIRNPGCKFQPAWYQYLINTENINQIASKFTSQSTSTPESLVEDLFLAVSCIDLTTLAGDDTPSNVHRLCAKALNPIREDIFPGTKSRALITCAAVCVYPEMVKTVREYFSHIASSSGVGIAAVSMGFPTGQYGLQSRLAEIEHAIQSGASEIDIVIQRGVALSGNWEAVYEDVRAAREVCGDRAHLKTILGVGELGTLQNVYKASMVAMMAGSDFIKTSTGKEAVNATLPVGVVMARAIREYHDRTGYWVGLKPAGGIRTSMEAIYWLRLIQTQLGEAWLNPKLFRIGASGLLGDLEKNLYKLYYGSFPSAHELAN